MAFVNHTDTYYYLDADGHVLTGDENAPERASTLLLAPGGSMDDADAKKYGLAGQLANAADVTFRHAITGEEIVHRGNRSYSGRAAEAIVGPAKKRPHGPIVQVVKEGDDEPKAADQAESKHQAGPQETKAVAAPAAHGQAGNAPKPNQPNQPGK